MSMSDYEIRCDPAAEWDWHCERQEQAYKAFIADKTCEDCGNCDVPDDRFKNPELIGYCRVWGEFVSLDDTPKEIDCDRFYE